MNVRKIISAYDPTELTRQCEQETLSDRDDGSYRVDDPDFFEWWYFDAHGADGCTVMLSLRDRNHSKMQLPPVPQFSLQVVMPDGENRFIVKECPGTGMKSSRTRCDVTIGPHAWALGRGSRYRVHVKEGDLSVDLHYEGLVPGWRPGTGRYYFGRDRSKYIGWVVPMPKARVTGSIRIGGRTVPLRGGLGYHDHIYGNTPITGNITNCHWGRGHAEDYTLVYCSGVPADRYGQRVYPNIMLAQGNRIFVSSAQGARHESGPHRISPITMNPYASEYGVDVPFNGRVIRIRFFNNEIVGEHDYLPLFNCPVNMSKPCHLRLRADLEISIPLTHGGTEVVRGKMLHEFMVFEPQERENPGTAEAFRVGK